MRPREAGHWVCKTWWVSLKGADPQHPGTEPLPLFRKRHLFLRPRGHCAELSLIGDGDEVSTLRDIISVQPEGKSASGDLGLWNPLRPRLPAPSPLTGLYLSEQKDTFRTTKRNKMHLL